MKERHGTLEKHPAHKSPPSRRPDSLATAAVATATIGVVAAEGSMENGGR